MKKILFPVWLWLIITKMALNALQGGQGTRTIDHVDGQTPVAKASCTSNTMQVCLTASLSFLIDWEVKVHDNRYLRNINACQREGETNTADAETHTPLAETFVVMRTFSLAERKRSITAALCSTANSPLSMPTAWPCWVICSASQLAALRVCKKKS